MICKKCGSEIAEGSLFCPGCGSKLDETTVEVAPKETLDTNKETPSSTIIPPQNKELPMGWYKFLINFSLFVGAILNILGALPMLTGTTYGSAEDAALVYAVFPGIQSVDVVYGLLCIALGAFQIYTRFRLSGFHENGPKFLLASYIGVIAVNLFYYIGLNSVIPAEYMADIDTTSIISGIISSAIFAVINYIYFKKREHLFTNT